MSIIPSPAPALGDQGHVFMVLAALAAEHPGLPAAYFPVLADDVLPQPVQLDGLGEWEAWREALHVPDDACRLDLRGADMTVRCVVPWRGVRLELYAVAPVAPRLAGLLAEQRHQLLDPPVMNPCSAARVAAAGIEVAA